jgi:two-component system, LytTR family, response regulator
MNQGTPQRTIRTLVVDDEPLARTNLILLLRRDEEIEIIGECGSGAEAVDTIRTARPDLVFLDVQMPECDGFDVVEMLGGEAPPALIFVTAYDRYALKAFEAGALDYLLKPFDNARFLRSLSRAKGQIARDRKALENAGSGTTRHSERLIVKSAGRVSFLNVTEIDWIEAADYYACLHAGGRTHLLRRTMNELESDLDPALFCRIHRSTIVNLSRISELTLDSDGEHQVVLSDGTSLRMSRHYQKVLRSRIEPSRDMIHTSSSED